MRTDVKVAIAGGAMILIVAVAYYGAKRNEGITLANKASGQTNALEDLLGSGQKDKPAAPPAKEKTRDGRTAAPQPPFQDRAAPANQNAAATSPRRHIVRRTVPSAAGRTASGAASPQAEDQAPAVMGPRLPPGFRPAIADQPAPVDEPQTAASPAGPPAFNAPATAGSAVEPQPASPGPAFAEGSPATVSLAAAEPEAAAFRAPIQIRPQREEPAAASRTHVVAAGDTFAAIAERHYGSERYTWKLMEANPTIDSRRLQIGAVVAIPPLGGQVSTRPALPEQVAAAAGSSYVVREGDTFYGIASRQLGSGERWREIYELNRTVVGGNPNQLKVGQELILPRR